jgi:hypothetical protein
MDAPVPQVPNIRSFPVQGDDVPAAIDQPVNNVATQKAGCPGYEGCFGSVDGCLL